ncbi:MAG: hypothetical protein ABUL44_02050, partial [Flavobacterium sp.]
KHDLHIMNAAKEKIRAVDFIIDSILLNKNISNGVINFKISYIQSNYESTASSDFGKINDSLNFYILNEDTSYFGYYQVKNKKYRKYYSANPIKNSSSKIFTEGFEEADKETEVMDTSAKSDASFIHKINTYYNIDSLNINDTYFMKEWISGLEQPKYKRYRISKLTTLYLNKQRRIERALIKNLLNDNIENSLTVTFTYSN